jgi:sigma-B regulation protein RsbU (phosphoserine phosphatase)
VQKDTPNQYTEFTIDFPTSPTWFKSIRMLIVAACTQCGFTDRVAGQVAMAVDEALCNIHRHGYQGEYGRATLTVKTTISPKSSIQIQIEDDAQQMDTELIKSRNLDDVRPGGIGVHLIQTVMDEALWTKREHGGMKLTMHKTITPETNQLHTETSTQ